MKCSDYIGWISRKLDGALSEEHVQELERHLSTCDRCRAELSLQERIVESLKEMGPSGLPADFTERVSDRVRRRRREERFGWRWPALIPALASTIAAVIVVVLRAEIAGAVATPIERFGARVAAPMASFGQSIIGAFASAPDLTGRSITVSESISPIPLTLICASAVACLAVAAAFCKASTLLRE
jgi:anti-sigma factor RsiW